MIPNVDYIRILPELVLCVVGVAIMMLDPLMGEHSSRKPLGWLGAIGTVAALAATWYQASYQGLAWWGMVRVDSFSIFFHVTILLITLAAILMSFEYLEQQQIRMGEYYALIVFAAVGMCLMSSAIELVLIFVALEISSIATYVLAGFRRKAAESAESSLKYFLLGSFATAFFLYGVAMMFGATGSTNVTAIAAKLHQSQPVLAR